MSRDQRAAKRTKARASTPGSGSTEFKYFGRRAITRYAPSSVVKWMEILGVKPAQRFFIMTRYVEVKRRLILRDVVATVERNGQNAVIERAMLNSIERFWLCIKRWHSQNLSNAFTPHK